MLCRHRRRDRRKKREDRNRARGDARRTDHEDDEENETERVFHGGCVTYLLFPASSDDGHAEPRAHGLGLRLPLLGEPPVVEHADHRLALERGEEVHLEQLPAQRLAGFDLREQRGHELVDLLAAHGELRHLDRGLRVVAVEHRQERRVALVPHPELGAHAEVRPRGLEHLRLRQRHLLRLDPVGRGRRGRRGEMRSRALDLRVQLLAVRFRSHGDVQARARGLPLPVVPARAATRSRGGGKTSTDTAAAIGGGGIRRAGEEPGGGCTECRRPDVHLRAHRERGPADRGNPPLSVHRADSSALSALGVRDENLNSTGPPTISQTFSGEKRR